jgi:glutathione synthase/RimK-type ligase-like ATP-grasp enzyme
LTLALAMSPELLASGGTAEDRLLAEMLAGSGVSVSPVSWDGESAWGDVDGVLIRSCWDYHLRPEEFRAWLDRLDEAGVTTWNPTALVRWNMDKRYLLDLEQNGVPIVPTVVSERVGSDDVDHLCDSVGDDELVVKPVVGATSYGLERVERGKVVELEGPGPWLVQPFLREVLDHGEWSLMFFSGRHSHSVIKKAAPGEFRVQKEWGGSARRARAPETFVAVATAALAVLDEMPVYARVDLALCAGAPCVMELELIEPELYLEEGDVGLDILIALLAEGTS